MKATDLLKNALVLQTGNASGLSDRLSGLIKDVQKAGVSSIAAYVYAQIDNERDPLIQMMRKASQQEIGRHELLEQSVEKMSSFSKVLNQRFGSQGTLLINADDPALKAVVASLPVDLIGNWPFRQRLRKSFDSVLSGSTPILHYLESFAKSLSDTHRYKKAVAELHREVGQGDQYNAFNRMAFLLLEEHSTFAHATQIMGKESTRFATLRFSPDSESNFSETWYPREIATTYLFSHELGHCLMPASLQLLSSAQFQKDGDENARDFRNELFANIYSACFMAKITASWDFLPMCVLPVRARDASCHNTFDVMQRLPKSDIDPKLLAALDEKDLVRAAENIYMELVGTSMNTTYKSHHDAAALLLHMGRHGELGSRSIFESQLLAVMTGAGLKPEPENSQMVIQLLLNRIQSEIDSIGMQAQIGISGKSLRESLLNIAQTIASSGNEVTADHLRALAVQDDKTLRLQLMGYMSKEAIRSVDQYEQTAMSVSRFWEDWRHDERQYQKSGALSPAPEGRAHEVISQRS